MKIVLSGGNLGGKEVLLSKFINNIYEETDSFGVTWIYDISLSQNPKEATFKGCK